MDFNIYDISELSEERISNLDKNEFDDFEKVEMGLSAGELRQSILDRVREDFKREEVDYINPTLEQFDFQISEDLLEFEGSLNSALQDVENLLYELTDEELDNSKWLFSFEVICIEGY